MYRVIKVKAVNIDCCSLFFLILFVQITTFASSRRIVHFATAPARLGGDRGLFFVVIMSLCANTPSSGETRARSLTPTLACLLNRSCRCGNYHPPWGVVCILVEELGGDDLCAIRDKRSAQKLRTQIEDATTISGAFGKDLISNHVNRVPSALTLLPQ